jgi:hypothetical protein
VPAHVPPPGTLFLDHVSHFVPDLDAAARALRALGFAVTPRSDQRTQDGPAGTSNVCVMLEEGYLEFLAPTADTPNAARLRAAMQRYPGVHLCCFGTPDAKGEHRRLEAHGFSRNALVQLARETDLGTARFKVARPSPGKMPEGRVQFVEHLTPEVLWNPEHVNRGTRLACAFVAADDPVEAAARWARFAALLPRRAGAYVHLATGRGHVLIGSPVDWHALLGARPAAPGLAGYALECREPAALAARCERNDLPVLRIRENLFSVRLPVSLGGAWLVGDRSSLGLSYA